MEPRIHPFIAGASVAVILLSGVGIAAVTGYLPGSSAQRMPEQAKKASEKPKAHPGAKTQVASAAPHAKAACVDCGVVVDVKEVEVKGKATGVGAVGGAVVGGVVGHEVGDHNKLATAAGAVGGAVIGHQIERSARATKHYDVAVRMPDGSVKTVSTETQPGWKSGDKVRIVDGKLQPQS